MALSEYAAGYTDDGPDSMVWFRFKVTSPDGTPLEATLMVSPKEADNIAKILREAADKCVNRSLLVG